MVNTSAGRQSFDVEGFIKAMWLSLESSGNVRDEVKVGAGAEFDAHAHIAVRTASGRKHRTEINGLHPHKAAVAHCAG